jgi:hypothetical protein
MSGCIITCIGLQCANTLGAAVAGLINNHSLSRRSYLQAIVLQNAIIPRHILLVSQSDGASMCSVDVPLSLSSNGGILVSWNRL